MGMAVRVSTRQLTFPDTAGRSRMIGGLCGYAGAWSRWSGGASRMTAAANRRRAIDRSRRS
jgi:hypothetical protein